MMVFKTQMHIFTSSQTFTELMGYYDCTVNTETHKKFELFLLLIEDNASLRHFHTGLPFWDPKAIFYVQPLVQRR